MLDTSDWKAFRFGDLIDQITKGVAYTKEQLDFVDHRNDAIPFVTRTEKSNCTDGFVLPDNLDYEDGNAIIIGDTTATIAYQDKPFVCGDHIVVIRADWLNINRGFFFVTLLRKEKYKYSYGRAFVMESIMDTLIKLPVTETEEIDWEWIDTYMAERMGGGCTKTNNVSRKNAIDTSQWQNFRLQEIFNIHYGVNLEYLNCEPVSSPEGVNFVSRTAMNCGVSGRVALIDGIEPEKKGTISIAGGGSVLSTFLQTEDYYSGRDLFVCESKEQLTNAQKLFVCALIRKEVYRFSYGRQANKSLLNLTIKLPVEPNGRPDWPWIETYMKSLPYGDLI